MKKQEKRQYSDFDKNKEVVWSLPEVENGATNVAIEVQGLNKKGNLISGNSSQRQSSNKEKSKPS